MQVCWKRTYVFSILNTSNSNSINFASTLHFCQCPQSSSSPSDAENFDVNQRHLVTQITLYMKMSQNSLGGGECQRTENCAQNL